MPGTDSPPPFAIRFRTREPQSLETRLYQQTLELTAAVEAMLDPLELARFHLRDLLDRASTFVALTCGKALAEPVPAERRKLYRAARPRAIECGTVLDILARRVARTPDGDPRRQLVDEAQVLLADILAKLEQVAAR